MLQTFQTLFPVFAVIGIGYALAYKTFLTKPFLDELNKLVYWICLPALMIANLDRAENLSSGSLAIILIFFAASILVMGVAYLAAKALGLKAWQYGTFIQGSFRGNIAFIGLPILIYALRDQPDEVANRIIAQAIFVFAPIMIFQNVCSVFVLVSGHSAISRATLRTTIGKMTANPLILATLAGLILYAIPFDLPVFIGDTLQFVGRTAAPGALICVGGGMALTSMEGRYRSATFSACLKVLATPLLAYLIALPFNLSRTDLLILMIFTATPTAVASYILAKQLDGDAAMSSGTIILSTLLATISLSVVIAVF